MAKDLNDFIKYVTKSDEKSINRPGSKVQELLRVRYNEFSVLLDYFKHESLEKLGETLNGVVDSSINLIDVNYKEFLFTILLRNGVYSISPYAEYYSDTDAFPEDVMLNDSQPTPVESMLKELRAIQNSMHKVLDGWIESNLDKEIPNHLKHYPFKDTFDIVVVKYDKWVNEIEQLIDNNSSKQRDIEETVDEFKEVVERLAKLMHEEGVNQESNFDVISMKEHDYESLLEIVNTWVFGRN